MLKRHSQNRRHRKTSRQIQPLVDRLDERVLLSVTLTTPGPITSLTLGNDGSFQVHHTSFSHGQVYNPDTAPGDAGLLVRQADGTVDGWDVGPLTSAAQHTNAQTFHLVSQLESADGQTVSTVLDNSTDGNHGNRHFQVTQVATLHPGDDFFRVDNTILNQGTEPLTIDVFAAADIYLADSDRGVGFLNTTTGAVGGEDRTGQYRIFIQPNITNGNLAPSHSEEAFFDTIWKAIGTSGTDFNDSVLLPTTSPPYDTNGDPNYIDNGAGLEWKAVTIQPGASASMSYYWAFGAVTAVSPTDPPLTATGTTIPLAVAQNADAAVSGTVATFTDADPDAQLSDYTATIDWGDGSSPTTGTIAADPGGGFDVSGTHTYTSVAASVNFPVKVTINDVGGAQTSASSAVAVTVTPPPDAALSASGTSLHASVLPNVAVPISTVVATFTDADPEGKVSDFSASIDWGDGSPITSGTVSTRSDGGFEVSGSHTYAGLPMSTTFPIRVTINDVGGASASANSTVAVTVVSQPDAPLSAVGTIFRETARADSAAAVSGAVATFTDADPTGKPSEFTAMIDWGDGQSGPGSVTSSPEGGFLVQGSHDYKLGEKSTTYTIEVSVTDTGGATTSASGTAQITVEPKFIPPLGNPRPSLPPPVAPYVNGTMNPKSDSGPSHSDHITNQIRPEFDGQATAGALLQLVVRRSDQSTFTPVGQTTADSAGRWSITSAPLSDGIYRVVATATTPGTGLSTTTQLLPDSSGAPLVIDSIGPKVTALSFAPRAGTITVTFADSLSGIDPASVMNPSVYSFMRHHPHAIELFNVAAVQLAAAPRVLAATGSEAVVITVGAGTRHRIGHGRRFLLRVRSGGVADMAGNSLDGTFRGTFPSGDGHAGGDFVANLWTDGTRAFPPRPAPAAWLNTAAASVVQHQRRTPRS
jgi:hypothetical protein